jgi:hypothetical protein
MLLSILASHDVARDSARRDIEGKLLALERVGKLQAPQLKDLKMLNEVLDEAFVLVDQDGALLEQGAGFGLRAKGDFPSISGQ